MDDKDLRDELLYRMVKSRVPEIPIDRVDESNRNMVIAVLEIAKRVQERRETRTQGSTNKSYQH
jgi:hypothetical protein